MRQEALVNYEIDEYDERFLRHLALGYQGADYGSARNAFRREELREAIQNELVQKLFPDGNKVLALMPPD